VVKERDSGEVTVSHTDIRPSSQWLDSMRGFQQDPRKVEVRGVGRTGYMTDTRETGIGDVSGPPSRSASNACPFH